MWKFNGIADTDMDIVTQEVDFTAKSSQRVNILKVDGKNGAEYIPLGYEPVELDMFLQLMDLVKENDIYAWLDGEGEFEFNGKVTNAAFYQGFKFKRDSSIKTCNINFIRSPFWYKANDDFEVINNTIENEGTVYSQPIIRLEKVTQENIELTIGGVRFTYDFNTDTYVEIDCQSGKVLYNGFERYGQIDIGFDLPVLPVGESAVIIHSGDAVVKVKRKDRWL